ncbi:C2H2 type zinc finger domain protein [Colletotrichum truncatum]|uniref:C2H2 type zinc finger domain protein n=1 Tax=Colletotrichum truncatum TaxID=5467 RepID=A0ACC3Z062_COLTU|nr:C2H2 type zinc finger domain protein [Colletotrichum truncatum]KAF6800753.1 C2H2 type zinc finger domain protein [Colletotrichum truncatum]
MMSSKGSNIETRQRPVRLSDPKVPSNRPLRIGKNSARGHRCHTCRPPKFFLNALELKVHRASNHFQEQCVCPEPGCDREFNNRNSLRRHIESHEGIGTKTTKSSLKQLELHSNSTDAESLLSKDAPRPNRPSTGTDNQQSNEGEQQSVSHGTLGSMPVGQQNATYELPTDTLSNSMTQPQEPQPKEQMGSINNLEDAPSTHMIRVQDQLEQADVNNVSQQVQENEPSFKVLEEQQTVLSLLKDFKEPMPSVHQLRMNSMDLPPPLLEQVGYYYSVPPEARKWKDVWKWAEQTNVSPSIRYRLDRVQRTQFVEYMQRQIERRNLQQSPGAQQQQQQQQQPQPQPQNSHQHPAQHLRQPQKDDFNHGQQDPDQTSKLPIPPHDALLMQVTPQDLINCRNANPKVASLTDDQLRAFIIQIKQRQWAAAIQKEMSIPQAQEQLKRVPLKLQPKVALSSSISIHSTISKDNTTGEDARIALLFADLGERLNSCPKTSRKNKPET